MEDQKKLWNKLHSRNVIAKHSTEPTAFAQEIAELVKSGHMVDLGCGAGNDSVYFANKGFDVLATDFSEFIIKKNTKKYESAPHLTFEVLDMSIMPYNFTNNKFDLIYSHLSLHYFSHETTKKIFDELYRILKPTGLLCFVCKSPEDPLYGKGKEIEKHMYELNGHARHFFTEEYARELLKDKFKIISLTSGKQNFYGKESGYVKVVAQK